MSALPLRLLQSAAVRIEGLPMIGLHADSLVLALTTVTRMLLWSISSLHMHQLRLPTVAPDVPKTPRGQARAQTASAKEETKQEKTKGEAALRVAADEQAAAVAALQEKLQAVEAEAAAHEVRMGLLVWRWRW